MNFGEAVKNGFMNYATFSGRASRSEFWYWVLFVILLWLAARILDYELVDTDTGLFLPLLALAVFIPNLAVAVRRLHDIDRSGWWWLISLTLIGIIVLLAWDCIKGTNGPNRFGPDPLASQPPTT
jgi:uncharacterized membrane protein YhaH (DUF805 family)